MSEAVVKPRLWGVWRWQEFRDGTYVVCQAPQPGRLQEAYSKPYLDVMADPAIDSDTYRDHSLAMCRELSGWLNDVLDRPAWLDDMYWPEGEAQLSSLSGAALTAMGPIALSSGLDLDGLYGREVDTGAARSDRLELIHKVLQR